MRDEQPWGRADLHMHTTASDGLPTPQLLLDHIARRGDLNVIAITDHNCLDASLWACSQQGRYPFEIVPAVEISSAHGDVLALWVRELIPRALSFDETVAAVHEQGGFAILAHPYHVHLPVVARNVWRYLREPQVLLKAKFDAIEVVNAGTLTPGSNLFARRVAGRLGMAMTASSDAHTLGAIGSASTRFPGRSASDLRAALECKQTMAEGSIWPLKEHWTTSTTLIYRVLNRFSEARERSASLKQR